MRSPRTLLLLLTLAIAVYAPVLRFPFIANSFIEIPVSRILGSVQAWGALLSNSNWHLRLSYVFANALLVKLFGFEPKPFYLLSLCLHAACVCLIYILGQWQAFSNRSSAYAAAFFAVYAGHYGEVMALWYWPGLLVTLFAAAALSFWVRWLQKPSRINYGMALLLFMSALVSSEGGFLAVFLLSLPLFVARRFSRRELAWFFPFVILALAQFVLSLWQRPRILAWNTSLAGLDQWWMTAVWTAVVLACLWVLKAVSQRSFAVGCASFVVLSLMVGAYLDHGLQVSSSTVYLASFGLALLVGQLFSRLQERLGFPVAALAGFLVMALNVGFLWTIERKQMLDFAFPTRVLTNAALYAQGPIRLSCFPFPIEIAQAAAQAYGSEVVAETKATKVVPHCISFSYKDAAGAVRQVYQRSAF